ncbi:MAG: thiamine-phosphate kinase [Paludibacteraceae bacterium]|nr:thiamine-phosphate kinase [Paludibacteraceae bacterium]MBR4704910.1 thiamine-phosphate kinase [Paludibacteraceae bacterium]
MQRTEISTLGEFGLIKRLTGDLKPVQPSTLKGVGDDCAVMDFGKVQGDKVQSTKDLRVLMTTDMLLEGIHFNLEYVPLKHLGYKAAVVNFSDIYAMNGTPTQITVNLGISKRFSLEDIEALYAGVRLACERYGVDIVGGDTCASMTGLTISITCLGVAKEKDIVYRNGAKLNDLICVSGNLGTAYMGLQLLERERIVGDDKKAQDAFEGKEYLLERQLKPEARRDILEALRKAGVKPTAMMDVSDGLSSELMHICSQSGVGCCIYEDKLPIDYEAAALAEEMNLNIVTCALNGGEDYELLFTCSLDDYEKLILIEDLYIIGHITKPEYGCNLIGRNGEELALKAQGWNAFGS